MSHNKKQDTLKRQLKRFLEKKGCEALASLVFEQLESSEDKVKEFEAMFRYLMENKNNNNDGL